MPNLSNESKRIKAFRLTLAKQIPKFPNDKASLQALQAKSLGALLIDYTNWAIRYVAPRPRTVVEDPVALTDPKWKSEKVSFSSFLTKVVQGDDLTPHLSLQPHTRGYTPASSGAGAGADRWADKDMLLNVMGYHHFHSDAVPHDKMRSDDVLFAHVTRDAFTVIGVFNHEVFKATEPPTSMTAERNRLWQAFEGHSMRGAPAGAVVVQSMIATSGHPLYLVKLSSLYARTIASIDPKLDERGYVKSLYEGAGLVNPSKTKLRWHIQFLDLGIFDERTRIFFLLQKGPI